MKTEEETANEMIAEFHAELYFDVGAKTQAINCAIVSCDRILSELSYMPNSNYSQKYWNKITLSELHDFYTKVKIILTGKL